MNELMYRKWYAMIARCHKPNHRLYSYYGQRGITVCIRWRENFAAFCEDMGECPEGMSLDRIDVNGNYEPSNCRWATWSTQMSNRRPYMRPFRRNDNPMQYIRKLPNGRYRVRMNLTSGERGKVKGTITRQFRTLEEAKAFRSEMEFEREMHRQLGLNTTKTT